MDRIPKPRMGGAWRLLAALLLTTAPALAEVSVTPTSGTSGLVLTIDAGLDLAGKKPKAWLERPQPGNASKVDKVTLTVDKTSVSGTTFQAELKHKGKLAVGSWDLRVRPRIKGFNNSNALLLEEAFEVLPPQLTGATSLQAAPGEEITLTVEQLGTKKGKVRVNGQGAKVKGWDSTSGQVRISLHKKTPTGSAAVVLETKLGTTELDDVFDVPQPDGDGPGGGSGIIVKGKAFQPDLAAYSVFFQDGSWQLSAFVTEGDGNDNRTLAFVAPLPTFPLSADELTQATMVQYSEGDLEKPGVKVWIQGTGAFQVSVSPLADQQLRISVDGGLTALLNASGTPSASGTETFVPLPGSSIASSSLITPGPALSHVDSVVYLDSWEEFLDLGFWVSFETPGGALVDAHLTATAFVTHDLALAPFSFAPEQACLLLDDGQGGGSYEQSFDEDGDLLVTVELLPGATPRVLIRYSGTLAELDGGPAWAVSGAVIVPLADT